MVFPAPRDWPNLKMIEKFNVPAYRSYRIAEIVILNLKSVGYCQWRIDDPVERDKTSLMPDRTKWCSHQLQAVDYVS